MQNKIINVDKFILKLFIVKNRFSSYCLLKESEKIISIIITDRFIDVNKFYFTELLFCKLQEVKIITCLSFKTHKGLLKLITQTSLFYSDSGYFQEIVNHTIVKLKI